MNSVFCCFFLRKIDKMLPKPWFGVNQFSATPRGRLNWTGPIANSSDFRFNSCSFSVQVLHATMKELGPATTQNLVVKFDGEICGGVLVENAFDDFPSKRSSKISCQTSPEVRHQFRQKLRQLHSGSRWCLKRRTYALAKH